MSVEVKNHAGSSQQRQQQQQRKPPGPKSLYCLIEALEGTKVVVETRRDTVLRGVLEACDPNMNLQMAQVTEQPLQGNARKHDYIFVKSRHVRFVHLPGSLDVSTAVQNAKKRAGQMRVAHRAEQTKRLGGAAAVSIPKGQQFDGQEK